MYVVMEKRNSRGYRQCHHVLPYQGNLPPDHHESWRIRKEKSFDPKKWNLLVRCLESIHLVAGEAKGIEAAQTATITGTLLGVLLVTAGLSLELAGRKRKMKTV
jgi:hypothetical protein